MFRNNFECQLPLCIFLKELVFIVMFLHIVLNAFQLSIYIVPHLSLGPDSVQYFEKLQNY